VVVERTMVYESPVALTPYRDEHEIDERALGAIIDNAYGAAGISPDAIDTGVVILTGEALRRENAEAIARILAEKGGDFVTATAGHHMEAMLAAYGSGAARVSFDNANRVLNVEIGGRLIVVDHDRIVRLDPAGRRHAARAGFDWAVGGRATKEELIRVAESMTGLLITALTADVEAVRLLYLTEPITDPSGVDGVMVSGGVAEYVYGRESRDFGDLGIHLGAALRTHAEAGHLGAPLLPAGACIRATALGASEYSVQLSGNTSCITEPGRLLPRRNLQVVKPDVDLSESIDPAMVAAAIAAHTDAFDLAGTDEDFALAMVWDGAPEYGRIRALAEGIASGFTDRIAAGKALYVMIDGDIARTLGAILRDEIGVANDMLVIDGILLRDFDYIDLGRVRLPSFTVPVTIKSLLFRDGANEGPAQRDNGGHHHHHHAHHHHQKSTADETP
jgi:ethanolamine utilization protein EutA